MTHDMLCLCATMDCLPDSCIKCAYCQCQCETIREARADERMNAMFRVLSTIPVQCSANVVEAIHAAAKAARGHA
jgi:hypothetical protein